MENVVIICNGHVFDPAGGIDYYGNLEIKGNKISSYETPEIPTDAKIIDAHGGEVLAGLIDVHTHCNWLGNYIGMPTDLACIPYGVTATIDAGSTGVSNYRSLFRYLDTCETKTKIMLHASASGQIMSKQFAENINPSVWDISLFEKAFRDYADKIVGLKIRVSKSVVGELGIEPLKAVVSLAEKFHTRVFVHTTNPVVSMEEITEILRPGDVVCHSFQGFGNTILENGKVSSGIWKARERGIIFDVSQGQGNFSLKIAERAISEGFLPDTISTDLNYENWNHPLVFSLISTMEKMMALGMKWSDVVERVTTKSAEQFGNADNMGTLALGTCADISILRREQRDVIYKDIHGNTKKGSEAIIPLATIIDGEVLYQASETVYN